MSNQKTCSVFPMLTPCLFSVILENMPKNSVKTITTRMQPSYKKQFKKRK
jgi:hypothetical protein